MNFDQAFERLLGHEGGFVDHPSDPGGATCWGVSERVARSHGYTGEMKNLPLNEAKRIAKIAYWDAVRADELPDSVRFDVFDAAYNSGIGQAIKWLQRALEVTTDGKLGPGTMSAARIMDPERLMARFNGHRLDFLNDLKTFPVFGKGWVQRIAENLKAA